MSNPASAPIRYSHVRIIGLLVAFSGLLLLSIFILQRRPDPSANPLASTGLNALQESTVGASAGTGPTPSIDFDSIASDEHEPGPIGAAAVVEPEPSARQVSPAQPDGPPEAAMVVELTNTLTFSPLSITIRAGETVEWRNASLLVHTVTGDPSKATVDGSVSLPSGGQPFDSGNLNPQAIFRHTFRTPGTYRYFCIPHEGVRMRGVVLVQ